MHHMDLVMGKHSVEEIGKGGNQSCPQGVGKVLDLDDYPVNGEVGCGPHLIGRLEELHSSWSTELKQSCRVTCFTTHLESNSTPKLKQSKPDRTRSTF